MINLESETINLHTGIDIEARKESDEATNNFRNVAGG